MGGSLGKHFMQWNEDIFFKTRQAFLELNMFIFCMNLNYM